MAKDKALLKRLSELHERDIAEIYDGERSRSSGGAVTDEGDVKTEYHLYECKLTGNPVNAARSIRIKVDDLEKIWDEARSVGRDWGLAVRIYCPESPLASRSGKIDIMIRPVSDDVEYVNLWS